MAAVSGQERVRRISVNLPDGSRLTRADLPPADTSRWVASRKELVAKAVHHGLLTEDEACARYALTPEELRGWISAWSREGRAGLKVSARNRKGRRAGASPRENPAGNPRTNGGDNGGNEEE